MALVRLQKLLSDRGVASRRKAEELIAQGVVKVNGRPVKVGDKADDRKDLITVHGKRVAAAEEPTYLLLNKPRGYITTMSDEMNRRCVADLVKDAGVRLFPVGRLDRESEGLLLMTNDGEFSNALMHPSCHVPKHYRVTLRGVVTEEQLEQIRSGILLEGKMTLPAEVYVLTAEPETRDKPARTVLEIVLYEGRNRQIRKMCEILHLEVVRLKRFAMGGVKLGMLPPGKWRELDPKEVRMLLSASTRNAAPTAEMKGRRGERHDPHSAGRRS